jgi:hypothetical protein
MTIHKKSKGLNKWMFLFCLLVIGLSLPLNSFSQGGYSKELSAKNGYKTIILGSDIKSLKQEKLTKLNGGKITTDSVIDYEYTDTTIYKISDNLKLTTIGVTTFKDKIVSINLIYNEDDGYKMLDVFKAAYGLYTLKPNRFLEAYVWHSDKVDLDLNFTRPNYGYALYTCKPLQDVLDALKSKLANKAAGDL